jgi:hypothetical protein
MTTRDTFLRDTRALSYLTYVDVVKGLNAGSSALRPAPCTLLKTPFRIPRDVLKRIVETFTPRDLPTPSYTRYDG